MSAAYRDTRITSAAALEYAMDIALEVVPHLVLEGLDQEPLLLAKPMAF